MIINAEGVKELTSMIVDDIFKKDFHEHGKVTSVLIINASDDPANERYIETKKKELDKYNVRCYVKKFNNSWSNAEIKDYIKKTQDEFTAVMVQDPIYDHLDYEDIISVIDYKKDIDGLHPMNQGLLYSGNDKALIPCTAIGVMHLLAIHDICVKGKKVVIVGRGKLVADPLAKLLEYKDATVTKMHTKTDKDYAALLIKEADIIIPCVGKDLSNMINPYTVGNNLEAIIGVGFRYENGRQLQDFDCNANWKSGVKVTSNTKATGLATINALILNLVQIKYK